jgi:hypothetical protein
MQFDPPELHSIADKVSDGTCWAKFRILTDGRRFSTRCTLESGHEGDHTNGTASWNRVSCSPDYIIDIKPPAAPATPGVWSIFLVFLSIVLIAGCFIGSFCYVALHFLYTGTTGLTRLTLFGQQFSSASPVITAIFLAIVGFVKVVHSATKACKELAERYLGFVFEQKPKKIKDS